MSRKFKNENIFAKISSLKYEKSLLPENMFLHTPEKRNNALW